MKNAATSKNGRDYTKYLFKGEQYGKGTLVKAVVKNYVEEHPKVTSRELKHIFPKKETGALFEVVAKAKEAKKDRFYTDIEDLIKTADAKVAVTSQWSKDNITTFIMFVKKMYNLRIQKYHLHV